MIYIVQQQIAEFLAQRGHEDTRIVAQHYLIRGGAVIGIHSVFANASAIWLFEQTEVRIEDKDGRVLMPINAVNQAA
jgi:hypothetical protein